jgi:guanylate kinase
MKKGKLIIFSAPSGAGKTTIVHHLLKTFPDKIAFSVSATTRRARGDEQHHKDYYFVSKDEFLHKVAKHEFVEFEEVYTGTFYGTLKSEIQRIWDEGKTVIFDLDVEGGLRLKKKYEQDALAIFVQPPSLEVLIERLNKRGTDTTEKVKERINKAEKELAYAPKFDIILENNQLAIACATAEELVLNFMNKKE